MHINRLTCLFGLLLLHVLAYGCTVPTVATNPQTPAARAESAKVDLAAEERKVKETLEKFFRVTDAKDWQAVEDILAADFEEYYSDELSIYKRDDFVKTMRDDNMVIKKMELKDVKVSVSPDGQMAWVKYQVLLESSLQGKTHNIHSLETVIFRKEGDKWRMTHGQASLKEL
jgi:ketosteroid isomerase-like protein